MPIRIVAIVLVPFLILGCDDQSTRNRAGPDRDGISAVTPDDKEMNAAIGDARARLPEFLAALKRGGPGLTRFSVKAKFDFPSGGEHIWIGDVSYSGTSFSGRVENVPRDIKGLKYGDAVTIQSDAVSDWLYVEDGRLVGAFTMRVIYRRMSPAQQQTFKQQLDYKFDW